MNHKPEKNKPDFVNKNEYSPDAPGIIFIKPVSELLAGAVDFRNYRLIKKSARYIEDVDSEWNKMTRNSRSNERSHFQRKRPLVDNPFYPYFKAECDACCMHEKAAMWLFKHYLSGLLESVIKQRGALPGIDRQSTRKVLDAIFRSRQLFVETTRDGRQNCDSTRRNP